MKNLRSGNKRGIYLDYGGIPRIRRTQTHRDLRGDFFSSRRRRFDRHDQIENNIDAALSLRDSEIVDRQSRIDLGDDLCNQLFQLLRLGAVQGNRIHVDHNFHARLAKDCLLRRIDDFMNFDNITVV